MGMKKDRAEVINNSRKKGILNEKQMDYRNEKRVS